jgi:hypothetical protein
MLRALFRELRAAIGVCFNPHYHRPDERDADTALADMVRAFRKIGHEPTSVQGSTPGRCRLIFERRVVEVAEAASWPEAVGWALLSARQFARASTVLLVVRGPADLRFVEAATNVARGNTPRLALWVYFVRRRVLNLDGQDVPVE